MQARLIILVIALLSGTSQPVYSETAQVLETVTEQTADGSFIQTPARPDHYLLDDLPRSPIMMWRIEKDGRAAHVAGSLHMAPDSLYPLPAEMTDAFMRADKVLFEVDPRKLNQSFEKRLTEIGLLSDGRALSDALDAETERQLHDALRKLNMPKDALENHKPWMAALILTISHTMQSQSGLTVKNGIDRHFTMLAMEEKKIIAGLETPGDQLELFRGLDRIASVEFLKKSLDELEEIDAIVTAMVNAWRQGDTGALWDMVSESFMAYPSVYKTWITDRNKAWAEMIDRLIDKRPALFIVVGAAHLTGPDSLLECLRERGFSVEQESAIPLAEKP